jgi:hypothetical protein
MPFGAATQASLSAIARGESFTPTRSLSDTSCRVARSHRGWSHRFAFRTGQRAEDVYFVNSPSATACAGYRGGPPPASLREKKMRSAAPEVPSIQGPPFRRWVCPQVGDKLWKRAPPERVGPSKEGTLGAAERIFFSRRGAGGGPAGTPAQAGPQASRRNLSTTRGPSGAYRGDSNRGRAGGCDKRCPSADRVGAKLSSRAIVAGGAGVGTAKAGTLVKRPLTRETSAPDRWNDGCESGRPIPRAGPDPRWGARRKPRGPTRGRGFGGSSVVLADRFRLQKSTSGAWPCAPGREERPGSDRV